MTKTNLCEMCRFSEIKIINTAKPLSTFSHTIISVQELITFCNYKCRYIHLLMPKCEFYKPKAGKIGKKLYQKQLGEN